MTKETERVVNDLNDKYNGLVVKYNQLEKKSYDNYNELVVKYNQLVNQHNGIAVYKYAY